MSYSGTNRFGLYMIVLFSLVMSCITQQEILEHHEMIKEQNRQIMELITKDSTLQEIME